jgi:co-chaperonin GroES (HSP10)
MQQPSDPPPRIRAYQDNVIVRVLPEPTMTEGGLHIPDTVTHSRVGTCRAEVIASGPGYYSRGGMGAFVPNETKPGDIVLIDRLAGQDYAMDLNVPRHNKASVWGDERGEFRIVRESGEIHCILEPD